MVDGVHYGRVEKRRIHLTDPQVRLYHAQRQSVEDQMGDMLDEVMNRDPMPWSERARRHLYLVATF